MNFSTEEMAVAATIFFPLLPPPSPPPPNFPTPKPPFPPSHLFSIPNVPRLTNFLITMILILIFPMVKFHRRLIHHGLGDLQEIFFQTDDRQVGTNTTQTVSGDCLIGELERAVER